MTWIKTYNFNLVLFSINFSHPLNFFESDVIAVLERMSFVIMQKHDSFFILANAWNQTGFVFQAGLIKTFENVSEIDESESV